MAQNGNNHPNGQVNGLSNGINNMHLNNASASADLVVQFDHTIFVPNDRSAVHKKMNDFINGLNAETNSVPYDVKTSIIVIVYDYSPSDKLQCIHTFLEFAYHSDNMVVKNKICDIVNYLINRLHGFKRNYYMGEYLIAFFERICAEEMSKLSLETAISYFKFLEFTIIVGQKMLFVQEFVSRNLGLSLSRIWKLLDAHSDKILRGHSERNDILKEMLSMLNQRAPLLSVNRNQDVKWLLVQLLTDVKACLTENCFDETDVVDLARKVVEIRSMADCEEESFPEMDEEAYEDYDKFVEDTLPKS